MSARDVVHVPSYLRPIAVAAGALGIIQSVIWMGLSITSLVAYYCHFDFTGVTSNMGSITGLTLFQIYFRASECSPNNFPGIDFTAVSSLDLMRPVDLHAWSWVYLMMSFFWFISSVTLVTHVKSKYIRWANVFLYFWIGITLATSVLDLVLGILFGLDFDVVMSSSWSTPFLVDGTGGALSSAHILIAAQAAIGTMFSLIFRGYIVWILNIVLVIYLFTQTLLVSDYNRLGARSQQGVSNAGFNDANGQHPIQAYGAKDSSNLWYNAPAQTATQPEPINNQSRTVFEERKTFYDSMPPIRVPPSQPSSQSRNHPTNVVHPANLIHPSNRVVAADQEVQLRQSNVVRELNKRQTQIGYGKPAAFPDPDYSPPMPRANPFESRAPTSASRF